MRNLIKGDPLLFLFSLYIFFHPIMISPELPYLQKKLILADIIFGVIFVLFLKEYLSKRKIFFPISLIGLLTTYMLITLICFFLLPKEKLLTGIVEIIIQFYLILVLLVSYYISSTRENLDIIFTSWGYAVLAICLIGVVGLGLYCVGIKNNPFIGGIGYNLPAGNYPRVMSTFPHGSYLMNYLAPSFFFLLYLRSKKYRLGKTPYWEMLLVLFIIISILTFSRAFLVWLGILIFWIGTIESKELLTKVFSISMLSGIILVIAFITYWNIFPIKFKYQPDNEEGIALVFSSRPSPRWEIWKQAWREIKKSPWWGRELSSNATGPAWLSGRFFPKGIAAHNTFIELWTSRGIFGLAIFLALIFWVLKKGLESRPLSLEQKSLIPAFLCLFLIFFLDHMLRVRFVYLIFGIFAGIGNKSKIKSKYV